jgi:hypothetical protein
VDREGNAVPRIADAPRQRRHRLMPVDQAYFYGLTETLFWGFHSVVHQQALNHIYGSVKGTQQLFSEICKWTLSVLVKTLAQLVMLHDAPAPAPKKEIARLSKIADNIGYELGELRRAIEDLKGKP